VPSMPPQALIDAERRANPRRVVDVTDYLLVTDGDISSATPAGWEQPADLGYGVFIERLDGALAERLLDASELRGYDWEPARQYSAVHAYTYKVWRDGHGAPPERFYEWDSAGRLYPGVQLSRLVRDNATSTEHAVRRVLMADGNDQLVPFSGFETHTAYRLYPALRGWLDAEEAAQLGVLMRCYWDGGGLPARVGRALYRAESVTRQRYLEDALPLLVGGWESLVEIGQERPTAQFVQRVPQIAAELDVTLSEDECRARYRDRSALVHGAGVDLSQPQRFNEVAATFNKLQEALRRTVRRAIEDRRFAAHFGEDARITAQWPATITVRGESRVI
jgi:hypothetical protein